MPENDKQTIALNLAKTLTDWTATLSAGELLIMGVAPLVAQAIEWAKREQIDPGPFVALLGALKANVAGGLADDAAYRQRHPGE